MIYTWEPNKNYEHVIELHLDRWVGKCYDVRRDVLALPSGKNRADATTVPEEYRQALYDISCIHGIQGVVCEGYSLRIERGKLFRWEALQPMILVRLGELFDAPADREPRKIEVREAKEDAERSKET